MWEWFSQLIAFFLKLIGVIKNPVDPEETDKKETLLAIRTGSVSFLFSLIILQ